MPAWPRSLSSDWTPERTQRAPFSPAARCSGHLAGERVGARPVAANRHFGDRTFWFRVADHEPWPWYNQLGLNAGLLEVWGSVVTAAFQVAVLAGCDPIVFVGTDLAYSDGLPYCRGSTYEFRWARTTAAGHELADLWRGLTTPSGAVRVPDLRGVETTTTPATPRVQGLARRARGAERTARAINATGAGLLVGAGMSSG